MNLDKLPYERVITVCCNQRDEGKDCCNNIGGSQISGKLKDAVKDKGLQEKVRVARSGCMRLCETGVNVMIYPDNLWLKNVTPNDTDEIIRLYIDTKA